MMHNRLQVGAVLKKRGWSGSELCCVCSQKETTNHIFFACTISKFAWSCFRECFEWEDLPSSVADLWENWIPKKFGVTCKLAIFMFSGLAWAIWKTRNKMSIEKKFPKSSSDAVFTGICFLQKWSILLKENDKLKIEVMIDKFKEWMKLFNPSVEMVSDIVEL
uniref:Reverse transcriptase zinc-binding domain-containing protein n=1 Tax=Arundo donax TaxID=35708 RepID=A0A0A9FMG5_ARUDO